MWLNIMVIVFVCMFVVIVKLLSVAAAVIRVAMAVPDNYLAK